MTKEGHTEDDVPLRKKVSCFLPIQHVFFSRCIEGGPAAFDLHSVYLPSRMIQQKDSNIILHHLKTKGREHHSWNPCFYFNWWWSSEFKCGHWKENEVSYCCRCPFYRTHHLQHIRWDHLHTAHGGGQSTHNGGDDVEGTHAEQQLLK